ncbi:MAG: hypothetical protein Q4E47_03330 [Candidatus Saccharibacteria bacterium]|nr:hypothetical protein [Candidatus Saccharibacteria bacterium]
MARFRNLKANVIEETDNAEVIALMRGSDVYKEIKDKAPATKKAEAPKEATPAEKPEEKSEAKPAEEAPKK